MRRLVTLCAVLALALSACSSGSDPEPEPATQALPQPGQCIAGESKDLDAFVPDYTSVVDCKKPHVYEIVDVLDVPKKFLVSGSRDKRLERRTELGKSAASGSLAKDFRAYADRACLGSVLLATGLEGVRAGEKWPIDAGVRPALVGAATLTSVGPVDQWAAGRASIVCSFRYTVPVDPGGPQGKLYPIQSSSSVPTYRALLTKDFPAERRACASYDEDNYLHGVLCTNQHNTEVLFSYEATLAFGKKFAESVDDTDITDAQWDKLVEPCAEALDRVLGPDIDEELVGSVYLADDWSRSHTAFCLITPESDKLDLPPGSLVGQAGAVQEVPRKKVDGGLREYAQGT